MSLMTARASLQKFSIKDPFFLDIETQPDWKKIFKNSNPLNLEIGFGMGDFLIEMATREPHNNFIGIDFTTSGVQSLLTKVKARQLGNVRVVYGDARNKLSALFTDKELETIYINYPDPWPKKRHLNRRLINPKLVNLIVQKLGSDGHIYLATDSESYAQQTMEYFDAEPFCQNMNQPSGLLNNRNGLPKTKYEKSFIYAGDKAYYLDYSRSLITDKSRNPAKKYYLKSKNSISLIKAEQKFKNNDHLLTEKFQNDEANAEDACDLKIIADRIAEAGDKEWAKKVYKKAETKGRDSLDFNWLAYSIVETLGDIKWAKSIYTKAEEKSESSLELNWLAYSIFETLYDKEWVKKLYEKATTMSGNIRELCDLADSIHETLGEVGWVKKILNTANEKVEEYSDCHELADIMFQKMGDKEKSKQLFKKAEDKASDCSDLLSLAESIYKNFTDKKWAVNLYVKAENTAQSSRDFCSLADSLYKNLNDKKWAFALYKKAEKQAKTSCELRDLADDICLDFGDLEWAKDLYTKSEGEAKFFYEFRRLAECLFKNLEDKKWARELYKKAGSKALYTSEFNCLTSSVRKNLKEEISYILV
jgi:tRNA (guanine-N7-)-methyltransferase